MKSNKQRRLEIRSRRAKRQAKQMVLKRDEVAQEIPMGTAPCELEQLAPYNSYGDPLFVQQGYYSDVLFKCCDCQQEEIWTAQQQKWWYEVAKGSVFSHAKRCRACRRIEQHRKAEARRIHQEGLA
jgi:hypothetical protein